MQIHSHKSDNNKSTAVANNPGKMAAENIAAVQLQDNRPQSSIQKKLVDAMTRSMPERMPIQFKARCTGLPGILRPGIENLPGFSMDDLKVHYNSSQPAQLKAHDHLQDVDMHTAPGQKKYWGHEAWQAVQQKQGSVGYTMQLKEKVNINEDKSSEKNAGGWYIQTSDAGVSQRSNTNAFGMINPLTTVIQRRIKAGIFNFIVVGRAGAHNTGANKKALKELMNDRHINANPGVRHVNNAFETAAAIAKNVKGLGLHIAHHVSDSVIQNDIATAANNYNAAPAANPALWNGVQAYINGINPPAALAGAPYFLAKSNLAYNTAKANLLMLKAVHPIPLNKASAGILTTLANSIANSPMNLHYGNAGTNMSLGHHGDPNSFAHLAPMNPLHELQRTMTWRSNQMRVALNAAGINPAQHDRSLADALAMGKGSLGHKQANAYINNPVINPALVAAGLPAAGYTHTSGSPDNFAQLF